MLANFGIKICSIIDKKLEDHVKQFGPINWDDYIKVSTGNSFTESCIWFQMRMIVIN